MGMCKERSLKAHRAAHKTELALHMLRDRLRFLSREWHDSSPAALLDLMGKEDWNRTKRVIAAQVAARHVFRGN